MFIGLYRALTNAAQDGLLTEGFFWIPSLGGPVALGADGQGGGLDWLFPFPPSIGEGTAALSRHRSTDRLPSSSARLPSISRPLTSPLLLLATGWGTAGAYLLLPALLIASQYASQKIMQPPNASEDPQQQQVQAILKFLPLMIGWFALNVPSGLTLYWFVNNILTTGQTLFLRGQYVRCGSLVSPQRHSHLLFSHCAA